jgi:hypothetical protein
MFQFCGGTVGPVNTTAPVGRLHCALFVCVCSESKKKAPRFRPPKYSRGTPIGPSLLHCISSRSATDSSPTSASKKSKLFHFIPDSFAQNHILYQDCSSSTGQPYNSANEVTNRFGSTVLRRLPKERYRTTASIQLVVGGGGCWWCGCWCVVSSAWHYSTVHITVQYSTVYRRIKYNPAVLFPSESLYGTVGSPTVRSWMVVSRTITYCTYRRRK